MATQPKTFLTPEQYLEIERKAEFKSEYYGGEMFAMSGARRGQNLIVWNLAGELGQQLRKRPCEAYQHDMRVRVSAKGAVPLPRHRHRLRRTAIPRRNPRHAAQPHGDRRSAVPLHGSLRSRSEEHTSEL